MGEPMSPKVKIVWYVLIFAFIGLEIWALNRPGKQVVRLHCAVTQYGSNWWRVVVQSPVPIFGDPFVWDFSSKESLDGFIYYECPELRSAKEN